MHEDFINRKSQKDCFSRLSEEAAEVIKAMMKGERFGFESVNPLLPTELQNTNAFDVFTEVIDVMGAFKDCMEFLAEYMTPDEVEKIAVYTDKEAERMVNFVAGMNFRKLQERCNIRNEEWTGNQWTVSDAMIEHVEEFGELASAVKRMRRMSLGVKGDGMTEDEAIQKAKDELGDMQITLVNIANGLNFDLGECTKEKFNKTSEKYDLKTRI